MVSTCTIHFQALQEIGVFAHGYDCNEPEHTSLVTCVPMMSPEIMCKPHPPRYLYSVRSKLSLPILTSPDVGSRVSQMPVVLIPIDFSYQPDLRPPHSSFKRSVVLRPFMTSDFMTGVPAVPGKDLPLEVSS